MSGNVDVKHISEQEIWVGENKTSLIDGNIIYVIANGEQTTEIANIQVEVCHQLYSQVEGKIHYLIDLNNCGKNSPEARHIWNQFCEHEKTNKVAIFGLHPVARVIASFVIGVSKKNNQCFFKTKEEALSWLMVND